MLRIVGRCIVDSKPARCFQTKADDLGEVARTDPQSIKPGGGARNCALLVGQIGHVRSNVLLWRCAAMWLTLVSKTNAVLLTQEGRQGRADAARPTGNR